MTHIASQWKAHYGKDLLRAYGDTYKSYIAITSPRAWTAVSSFLPHKPRHLEFQQGMGETYLDQLVSSLPDSEWVLAIGGGNAIDVGKYAAWELERRLILIPTIVSTGAVFQKQVPVRRPDNWDFLEATNPEYLLFDSDVIRSAPPRLNHAGMGECICNVAVVGSWKWWTEQGLPGPAWNQDAADGTMNWVRQRVSDFSRDLDENGQLGEIAIRTVAEINRERYQAPTWDLKVGHGLDHVFSAGFEWVHGRELMHSEAVALGSLINAYLYQWAFDETKSLLDACRVLYRTQEIGCTHDEVRQVLDRINELNDRLGLPENWFHRHQLDDTTFANMMEAIEG